MRWFENKAFPHPVLSPFSEMKERDYVSQDFQAACKFLVGPENCPVLKIRWDLREQSILKLIRDGQAVYAAEVYCPKTYFRCLLTSKQSEFAHTFGRGELHERTEVSAYVACLKQVQNHNSENFHEEFGENASFALTRGDVMAIGLPSLFWWDLQLLKPLVSVFDLKEDPGTPANAFRFSWDEDYIQILMRPETKDRFNMLRGSAGMQPFAIASVYLSALTETLRIMAEEGTVYEDKKWYRAIMHGMKKKKINFGAKQDFTRMAQQLMDWPLGQMVTAGEGLYGDSKNQDI